MKSRRGSLTRCLGQLFKRVHVAFQLRAASTRSRLCAFELSLSPPSHQHLIPTNSCSHQVLSRLTQHALFMLHPTTRVPHRTQHQRCVSDWGTVQHLLHLWHASQSAHHPSNHTHLAPQNLLAYGSIFQIGKTSSDTLTETIRAPSKAENYQRHCKVLDTACRPLCSS